MDPEKIFKHICNAEELDYISVRGKSHKRELVQCRQIGCYVLKELTKLSLADIGVVVKSKAIDHSTVLWSINQVKTITNDLKTYPLMIRANKYIYEITNSSVNISDKIKEIILNNDIDTAVMKIVQYLT